MANNQPGTTQPASTATTRAQQAPQAPRAELDQLDQLEANLVASYDAIDTEQTSLSHLAVVAQAIDAVRAVAAGTEPAQPAQQATRPQPTRPSLATLAHAAQGQPSATTHPAKATARATARLAIPTGEATIADALHNALRHNASNQQGTTVVASVEWKYPPERQLTTDDPSITTNALNAALAPASNPASLIAAGGICGPVDVDFNIPTFSTSTRPVKDGLPSFQATRGGISFNMPVKVSDAGAGTTIWTVAKDTDGTSTKPALTIACPTPQTVNVYGVPTMTTMGNMQQRYSPELIRAWLNATEAAAARAAELALLQTMTSGSLAVTTTSRGLGAARELLPIVDQAAAGLRYRERQARTSPTLRLVMPEWVQDLLRADVARELAHDTSDASNDALALADTRLTHWFAQRNIVPIWALDDTGTPPFLTQAAGALAAWPATVTCLLFAEGTWVFLDGGRLDVGYIRDATLNADNQVQMFVEPFEAVAFRGIESLALTIALDPSGGSAGTVAPA